MGKKSSPTKPSAGRRNKTEANAFDNAFAIYDLRFTIYDVRVRRLRRGRCNAQALVVGESTGCCYKENGGRVLISFFLFLSFWHVVSREGSNFSDAQPCVFHSSPKQLFFVAQAVFFHGRAALPRCVVESERSGHYLPERCARDLPRRTR